MPIVGIVVTHGTFEWTGTSCPTSRDDRARVSLSAKLKDSRLRDRENARDGGGGGRAHEKDRKIGGGEEGGG